MHLDGFSVILACPSSESIYGERVICKNYRLARIESRSIEPAFLVIFHGRLVEFFGLFDEFGSVIFSYFPRHTRSSKFLPHTSFPAIALSANSFPRLAFLMKSLYSISIM